MSANQTHNVSPRPTLTFEDRTTPTNDVVDITLSSQHVDRVRERQVVPSICILRKDVLEPLWYIAPLIIVCACVSSMLRPVHVFEVDAEQRIRNPAARCRIREVDVYDERCDDREKDAESNPVEADEGVVRRNHTIAILIEEVAMLL